MLDDKSSVLTAIQSTMIAQNIVARVIEIGGSTEDLIAGLDDHRLWKDIASRIVSPEIPRIFFSVDYRLVLSTHSLLERYSWINPAINNSDFPPEPQEDLSLEVSLLELKSCSVTSQVRQLIAGRHQRPISLRELLSADELHFKRLQGIGIAALGSVLRSSTLGELVPVQVWSQSKCELRLRCLHLPWSKGWVFGTTSI